MEDEEIAKQYPYRISKIGESHFFKRHTGIALLSRYPIVKSELFVFKATQRKLFPLSILTRKGVLYAEIKVNGSIIGVFGTHLFWGRTKKQIAIRKNQITELRQFVESKRDDDKPVIISGDFNTMTPQYEDLRSEFPDYIDWWINTHDTKIEPGYTWDKQNTFVYGIIDNHRFDMVLSSPNVKPISTQILKPNDTIEILPWKPINKLERKYRVFYFFCKYLRCLSIPFGLLLHSIRLIHQLPAGIFNSMDLSDHYPLEGIAEINAN
jgi:hypothetical protein